MSLSPGRIPLLLLGVVFCQACRCGPTAPSGKGAATKPDAEPAPDPALRTPADTAPGVRIFFVSAGQTQTCGLVADNAVICWGGNQFGESTPPAGAFNQISAGNGQTCGLRTDGGIACWGRKLAGDRRGPPAGKFVQLSTGRGNHVCALGLNNEVVCWGDNSSGACEAPAGRFLQVSVGGGHTCGLRLDGAVICWGRND